VLPERHGYRLPDFVRAMQSLFKMNEIKLEKYGRPSNPVQRIVRGVSRPF
jgi:hypothetical protein